MFTYMRKVKVADDLHYKIGLLQRGFQVSPDIPKVIITPSEDTED